jgi:hypothetical protein
MNDAVTMRCEADPVDNAPAPTGICVIRLEGRVGGVLITIMSTPDIARRSDQQVRHTVNVESAVVTVREILTAFVDRLPHEPTG